MGDAAGHGATGNRRQALLINQEHARLLDLGRAQHLLAAHHEVHELMLAEAPLGEVLTRLVRGIERHADGMIGTVLLFDAETRTLGHCAAPSLPRSYVEGIDGSVVGPEVGSCGAAAYHGREVIVDDIEHDPRWRAFRQLARDHSLRACWSAPVLDASGEVLGTFALYYDAPRKPSAGELRLIRQSSRLAAVAIERHRVHAELKRLATRDTLTGLPNRALLVDRLTQALARSQRTGSEIAVVFCDLDDFKLVNDSLGHELGDWVLREVAGRLAAAVRPGDTVARFGGDEFVVVADGITAGGALRLAQRLHGALDAPFVHPASGEHAVGTTLGIALADAGVSAEEAIRRADNALYDAKRAGVPTRVYSHELHQRANERLKLHGELRRALAREQLRLLYQPVFDLASDRVVAFEALMRWDNPQLGSVSPARFIPAAEQTGLIVELGEWALRTAAAQARRWAEQGTPVTVAVNLSARQLLDPELPARVERALAATELSAELLIVEVTETALLDHDVLAARSLAALAALGVHIALDDFGTGYSSFGRLRRLPIDAIKIDREFVAGLGVDPDANAIVTAIVGLARGLDLLVTAEGVETPEQLELLREQGVTHVQGFHLGRPQDPAAAGALLRRDGAHGPS
ncbi:EAL domain-containing protein [Conexibacter sp. JD483]|uniref:putative bifunctional diguanylate cyclase/phosphodiesterase n=1 Tax=unclassified Conexibacter TaxID=2627773 RepID=UPI002725929E|nr:MULTISPECIES: EAL domain-containing protein [unclassified Conexibacter]MDO8184151.1 EAL domain-containing protein [Conexibacter sp. CPCC 205706]MDO8197143.1 EAL domain-containing protein [Conexibacter sp. CPCC 205762]MDR9367542.1 EAL domain-containing protein [Conexibacter sp. JD483]